MEYVLPGLVTVFILLFLLRHPLKRALMRWMEGDGASGEHELREIIAQEKKQMQDEASGQEGR